MQPAGWAAASTALSPDWVSAGTITAGVAVLGVIGGAIAWVRTQLNRGEDLRAAEQRRLDELHRDDREWWGERLGVKEMERDHRATLAAVEAAHRVQLDDQHAEHLAAVDALQKSIDRVTRATEVRGLRHRRWDENVRRDIVAMGGRDPGDPPPMYATDGDLSEDWVTDPPPESDEQLPARRADDDPAGP